MAASGTLTLGGKITSTGSVVANGGVLNLTASGNTAQQVAINNGSTLDIGGILDRTGCQLDCQ